MKEFQEFDHLIVHGMHIEPGSTVTRLVEGKIVKILGDVKGPEIRVNADGLTLSVRSDQVVSNGNGTTIN